MDDLISNIQDRKQDHIRINLDENVNSSVLTGFDHYFFENNALPDLDLLSVDTNSIFLGKKMNAPILISSMTGGTKDGHKINTNLAIAAETRGIAIGLGSQRAGLEDQKVAHSFNLRNVAPSIPIFSNIGAIQLNYGVGLDECRKVVEMANADALILHLNALQEALQPEGQTNFFGLLPKIENVCKGLQVPVIVKEVGWGISKKVAQELLNCGVSCVDVAGAGGTSWSEVEKFRNKDESRIQISSHFADWGIPTADCIQSICRAFPDLPVIASGGIRKGIDLAKSLALGASIGAAAGVFLKAASQSSDSVLKVIDEFVLELKIVMFAVGAKNIEQLRKVPIQKRV